MKSVPRKNQVFCTLLFFFLVAGGISTAVLAQQTPYTGTAYTFPGTVQAENYDNGGEGVAYHDTTPNNICNPPRYRFEDVDIQTCYDSGGGYNVGYIVSGEWLEYTVQFTRSGYYDLKFRVAGPGGTFALKNGAATLGGYREFFTTYGSQTWKTVTIPYVYISSGTKVIRFYVVDGGFNFNWFSCSLSTQSPFRSTVYQLPTDIEAENFNNGGNNISYYDTTAGNICYYSAYRFTDVDVEDSPVSGSIINVGYIAANEWLQYTVNLPTTQCVGIRIKVAAPNGGSFRIQRCDGYLTPIITIPSTGTSNQSYVIHDPYMCLYMPRGRQYLRIVMVSGDWNFDKLIFY